MNQVILLNSSPRVASILIEVPVTINGQGRVPFPDIAQLRSTTDTKIILKTLQVIPDAVLTNSMVVSGVTAPLAELQKMAIVLYSEGWEKGQYIPVLTTNNMITPGTAIPYKYGDTNFNNWVNVDWPKSYLQFANGTTSASTPYVVLFDCQYLRLNAQENEVRGPSK